MPRRRPSPPQPEPQALADHPVLDFINTFPLVGVKLVDCFRSDADVVRWLAAAGLADAALQPPDGLLEAARELRRALDWLVSQRTTGEPTGDKELLILNGCLAAAPVHAHLVPDGGGAYELLKTRQTATAAGVLAPLAEAAAELLAQTDFSPVRRCESPTCVMWFYDRTKGHRRRWCSMTTCGNRAKVQAFRGRSADQNAAAVRKRAVRRKSFRSRKALL